MKRMVIWAAAAFLLLALLWQWQFTSVQEDAPRQLVVAFPMGIQAPILAAVAEFEDSRPGVTLDMRGGTPEALARAVVAGTQTPDVFISPGGHEVRVLADKGLVDPDSMAAFGSYGLALLVPVASGPNVTSPQGLLRPEIRSVSLSDREFSSVTYATRQALEQMGLWQAIEPKILFTDDCMQAYQAVVKGEVDANLQFVECPMRPGTVERAQKARVAEAYRFPKSACYVPRNVAGALPAAREPELARDFIGFLTAPGTQELMLSSGMRNDADLPLIPGAWGAEHEAPPESSTM